MGYTPASASVDAHSLLLKNINIPHDSQQRGTVENDMNH
jgi:hypothetical protein